MLKCSFGYRDQQLLSMGSCDGKIYIWHIFDAAPIAVIDDPKSQINLAVAWHPIHNEVIVTATDDYQIVLWSQEQQMPQTRNLFAQLPKLPFSILQILRDSMCAAHLSSEGQQSKENSSSETIEDLSSSSVQSPLDSFVGHRNN